MNKIEAKFVRPEELRNRDYKLVFANGVFDFGPHHIDLLLFAKEQGDKLVVAVNSDASVKRLKGEKRPIFSLADRMKLLGALECVDFVVSFEENTPLRLIEIIRPDRICKGSDYQAENVVGASVVGKENIILFPLVAGYSTTKLIEKIKNI